MAHPWMYNGLLTGGLRREGQGAAVLLRGLEHDALVRPGLGGRPLDRLLAAVERCGALYCNSRGAPQKNGWSAVVPVVALFVLFAVFLCFSSFSSCVSSSSAVLVFFLLLLNPRFFRKGTFWFVFVHISALVESLIFFAHSIYIFFGNAYLRKITH